MRCHNLIGISSECFQECLGHISCLHDCHLLSTFACCLLQRVVSPLSHAASLRIGNLLGSSFHKRFQSWHEWQHFCRILHQLTHVINNLAARALDLFGFVIQPTSKHGKCG